MLLIQGDNSRIVCLCSRGNQRICQADIVALSILTQHQTGAHGNLFININQNAPTEEPLNRFAFAAFPDACE